MKYTVLLVTVALIMACAAMSVFAVDVIAVLDFKSLLADEELGIAVSEILRTELASLGDYTVIERGMLEQILEEQALQSSGAIDSGTAAEIGKLLGANLVVTGSIVKTGDVYTINSRFIDIETGVIKTGQNIRGEGENEISNMVHQLALVITGRTIVSEEALATATPSPKERAPQRLILFSFEEKEAGNAWGKSSPAIKVSRSQEYAADGSYAAQVVFPKSREQQSVFTEHMPTDWSAYAVLEFHAFWNAKSSKQNVMLGVVVEDAQSAQGQAFSKEFLLHRGNNRIWFGLDEIGQTIDLTNVTRFAVSSRSSDAPLSVYIDSIQLSTAEPQQQPRSPQGDNQQQPETQPGQASDENFPGPPPEALRACDNKQPGDACQFMTPHGSISGTCRQTPNQQVGCAPAGGLPQRNQPPRGAGKQPRPPKK